MTAQICAQFFCGFRWFQVESPLLSDKHLVLDSFLCAKYCEALTARFILLLDSNMLDQSKSHDGSPDHWRAKQTLVLSHMPVCGCLCVYISRYLPYIHNWVSA